MGPMPLLLIAPSSSCSSAATFGSGWGCPIGLKSASLASLTVSSAVPPMPTPTSEGVHPCPPAASTQSSTNLLMPLTPSAGNSIFIHVMFSEPEPLGIMRISRQSKSFANEKSTTGMRLPVLSARFCLVRGSQMLERNG